MPPETMTNRGKYEPYARAAAKAYGIDESFFISLLTAENDTWDPTRPSFDTYPDGRPRSIGIGQITEETARGLGIDPADRSNPEIAIPAAAKLVSILQKKYNNDWWKMAAAYNAGEGAVDRAIAAAGGERNEIRDPVGGDWRVQFARASKDYQTTLGYARGIIDSAVNNGGRSGPEITDFARAAAGQFGFNRQTLKPGTKGPPDFNDSQYLIQNEDGSWSRNYEQWSKDNLTYLQGLKLQKDLSEGPEAEYYDDVVKEISAQIAAGNYNLARAKTELDTRTSVYSTILNNAAEYLSKGLPTGSEYLPGGEPGGFYEMMGLKSQPVTTQPVDLFSMGLDLVKRSESLMGGLPEISSAPIRSAFSTLYPNIPNPYGMQPTGPNISANTFNGVQWSNPFGEAQNVVQQSLQPSDFSLALDSMRLGQTP